MHISNVFQLIWTGVDNTFSKLYYCSERCSYFVFVLEKQHLDSCLVDLEFRFNELVTFQEEVDKNDGAPRTSSRRQTSNDAQSNIKMIVNSLDSKIKDVVKKIGMIGLLKTFFYFILL